MFRSQKSRRASVCAAALAAVSLTASCSGGDDSTTNAAETAGADLTDPAVKVMTMSPQDNPIAVQPGVPAVENAAAATINANGGINGGKREVINCNEQVTPAGAQAWAEQAVNEGVAAVVGSSS